MKNASQGYCGRGLEWEYLRLNDNNNLNVKPQILPLPLSTPTY